MFCTKCGHELEADARFCTACGKPVEAPEPEVTAPMPREAQSAAPAPAPALQPVPAPQPAASAPTSQPAASAVSPDASVATPVVPAVAPSPAPASDQPAKKPGMNPVVLGGVAAVVIALLVVALLVLNPFGDNAKDSESDQSDGKTEQVEGPISVSMKLPRVDCSNFPQVKAYVVISPAADQELDNFDSSMFVVNEEDEDGNSYTNKVSDCTSLSKDELADLGISKKDADLAYVISFKSGCSDETASRTLTISCAEDSGYEGSAQTGVTPKAESSKEEETADHAAATKDESPTVVVIVEHDGGVRDEVHQAESGYILPYSDTYQYSYGELSGYNTWELYLARNEIFARHGRGFKNADLRSYFNSCSWYSEIYSPQEFDSIEASSGILNSVEKKNAETIKSVERDKGSSYL